MYMICTYTTYINILWLYHYICLCLSSNGTKWSLSHMLHGCPSPNSYTASLLVFWLQVAGHRQAPSVRNSPTLPWGPEEPTKPTPALTEPWKISSQQKNKQFTPQITPFTPQIAHLLTFFDVSSVFSSGSIFHLRSSLRFWSVWNGLLERPKLHRHGSKPEPIW